MIGSKYRTVEYPIQLHLTRLILPDCGHVGGEHGMLAGVHLRVHHFLRNTFSISSVGEELSLNAILKQNIVHNISLEQWFRVGAASGREEGLHRIRAAGYPTGHGQLQRV